LVCDPPTSATSAQTLGCAARTQACGDNAGKVDSKRFHNGRSARGAYKNQKRRPQHAQNVHREWRRVPGEVAHLDPPPHMVGVALGACCAGKSRAIGDPESDIEFRPPLGRSGGVPTTRFDGLSPPRKRPAPASRGESSGLGSCSGWGRSCEQVWVSRPDMAIGLVGGGCGRGNAMVGRVPWCCCSLRCAVRSALAGMRGSMGSAPRAPRTAVSALCFSSASPRPPMTATAVQEFAALSYSKSGPWLRLPGAAKGARRARHRRPPRQSRSRPSR
jgi:hypothetical protein